MVHTDRQYLPSSERLSKDEPSCHGGTDLARGRSQDPVEGEGLGMILNEDES